MADLDADLGKTVEEIFGDGCGGHGGGQERTKEMQDLDQKAERSLSADGMSGETDPGYVWCAIILMALSRTSGFGTNGRIADRPSLTDRPSIT